MSPGRANGVNPSRVQLPAGGWPTVLCFLCHRFPHVPEAAWRARMAAGKVTDAAGHALQADAAYRVGLEVRYVREVEAEPVIPFTETVLHLDEHLLVVDKPHFLPVMPAGRHVEQTLLARLIRRTGNVRLVPLHRLDRDTAGVMLFSTQPASRAAYHALFREQRIGKTYHALAPPLPGLVFPLQRESRLQRGTPFMRMQEVPGEANACTWIDVIDRVGPAWRYVLRPATGRKHQLRVHMAALGAPIFGDRLYPEMARPVGDCDRSQEAGASGTASGTSRFDEPLRLLAHALSFDDPLDGSRRVFQTRQGLFQG